MKNFFILLFLVSISEQIEILASKFKPTSGMSVSLDATNPAIIGVFNMSSSNSRAKSATCHRKCQVDSDCAIVAISWSNSTCYFFNVYALGQTRYAASNVEMYIKSATKLSTNGLINYWPFHNDYRDYKGSSDLTPQITTIEFANDRFNLSNEALSFRVNGYYQMPADVYLYGDFTVSAWVRVYSVRGDSKIFDFGNPGPTDDLEFSLSGGSSGQPYVAYNVNGGYCQAQSSIQIPLGDWHHLAGVLQGYNMSLYMDGVIVSTLICPPQYIPTSVVRNSCMIGRSNWGSEEDADADYDELKIYNRSLEYEEILKDMNNIPF